MLKSVISQIRQATLPENRLAAGLGAAIGALPPIGSYTLAHYALDPARPLHQQFATYLVAGLLAYSGVKVVGWTAKAFDNRALGLFWTIGVEGMLIGAPANLGWLSAVCVAYLVVVNAISAASGFVADYQTALDAVKLEQRASRASRRQARPQPALEASNRAKRGRPRKTATAGDESGVRDIRKVA